MFAGLMVVGVWCFVLVLGLVVDLVADFMFRWVWFRGLCCVDFVVVLWWLLVFVMCLVLVGGVWCSSMLWVFTMFSIYFWV